VGGGEAVAERALVVTGVTTPAAGVRWWLLTVGRTAVVANGSDRDTFGPTAATAREV
jgi:hypothetical protein